MTGYLHTISTCRYLYSEPIGSANSGRGKENRIMSDIVDIDITKVLEARDKLNSADVPANYRKAVIYDSDNECVRYYRSDISGEFTETDENFNVITKGE